MRTDICWHKERKYQKELLIKNEELRLAKRAFLVREEELEDKLARYEKKQASVKVIHKSYQMQINRLSLKIEMDKLEEHAQKNFEESFLTQ